MGPRHHRGMGPRRQRQSPRTDERWAGWCIAEGQGAGRGIYRPATATATGCTTERQTGRDEHAVDSRADAGLDADTTDAGHTTDTTISDNATGMGATSVDTGGTADDGGESDGHAATAMIGPMSMAMGGQGQSVMGIMPGPGLSMVPQTPRPLPVRAGIEEPWPHLMQAAQTAATIAMSPLGSPMHPPGATPLQARQAMALQAHTPMQMATMPGMTMPLTPMAHMQHMTAPAAAQGLQVPGIRPVTPIDAGAAEGAQQFQMSPGTQAQRAGVYTEAPQVHAGAWKAPEANIYGNMSMLDANARADRSNQGINKAVRRRLGEAAMGGMPRSHKGPMPEQPGLDIGRETMIDPHMLSGLPVDDAMFQHAYTAYFCDLTGDLVARDYDGEIRIVC